LERFAFKESLGDVPDQSETEDVRGEDDAGPPSRQAETRRFRQEESQSQCDKQGGGRDGSGSESHEMCCVAECDRDDRGSPSKGISVESDGKPDKLQNQNYNQKEPVKMRGEPKAHYRFGCED